MKDEKKKAAPSRKAAPRAKNAGANREQRAEAQGSGEGERVAKRLARAGIASRRDAEAMVAAGRVTVNGRVLSSPAVNVRLTDRIEVDGAPIPSVERTRLFLFHKPAGVVTTSRDPEGRTTIFDILPSGLPRLITVGRLDINTEGLLLFTNDGGLARLLELPSTGWLRRYRVRVHGKVDPRALAELEHGIAVDGVFYGAITATLDRQQGSNAWLTIGLREGKNREVKNVLGALGLDVTRLIRISYGPFQLGDLPEGAVQEIKGRTLRDQLGERLVEQARANFDAPVLTPFANKPVRGGKPAAPEAPRKETGKKQGGEDARKAVPRRKSREEQREEVLGRLQTKAPPPRDRKAGSKRGPTEKSTTAREGKPKRAPLERRSRAANVWMAPGARPVARKRTEEPATAAERKAAPAKSDGVKAGRGKGGKSPGPRTASRKGSAARPAKGPKGR